MRYLVSVLIVFGLAASAYAQASASASAGNTSASTSAGGSVVVPVVPQAVVPVPQVQAIAPQFPQPRETREVEPQNFTAPLVQQQAPVFYQPPAATFYQAVPTYTYSMPVTTYGVASMAAPIMVQPVCSSGARRARVGIGGRRAARRGSRSVSRSRSVSVSAG